MNLSGNEYFEAPVETVFDNITDLEQTVRSLPGLERIEKLEPTRADVRVKPTFSFVTGSMHMGFEVLERERPHTARMRVRGKGIGASVVIETSLRLSPEGSGTRLEWASEVTELGGLLKAVSRSLVEAAAKKIVSDSWVAFRKRLAGAGEG
jgi:carbon monoxide dehydrogenase subunit G